MFRRIQLSRSLILSTSWFPKQQFSDSAFKEVQRRNAMVQTIKKRLEELNTEFTCDSALETLKSIISSSTSLEDASKSNCLIDFSKIIVDNSLKFQMNRFHLHQIVRTYLNNKLPSVQGFSSFMIDLEIQEFRMRYTEFDEGHNLLQFLRAVVLHRDYTQQQLLQIADIFNKEYRRVNIKHAVLSLYYAHISGQIEHFQILIKIIEDLHMFVDFTLLSTICLISEIVTHAESRTKLHATIQLIMKEILTKQNDVAQNFPVLRCDALVEFLRREKLMTNEFDQLCSVVRERIALKPQDKYQAHTKYLTKDQEEQFQKIIQGASNPNSHLFFEEQAQMDEDYMDKNNEDEDKEVKGHQSKPTHSDKSKPPMLSTHNIFIRSPKKQ